MSAQQLAGSIEKIISRNEQSTWSVLQVEVNGESQTVVGLVPHVDEGLRIQAEGSWHRHPTFGDQFKADNIRLFAPVSKDGIQRWLQSGAVHGIGKGFAEKIVERFGEKTLDVIENDSWRLKKLKGVGPKRIEAVRKGVKEYRGRMETMSFLHARLGPVRAQRVYDKYEDKARSIISENPYQLVDDFDGFGFLIADQVAREVGVANDHPMRLRAVLMHVLKEAAKQGHTCLATTQCLDRAKQLLNDAVLANKAMVGAAGAAGISVVERDSIASLELTRFKKLEEGVARRLKELVDSDRGSPVIDADKAIPWAEVRSGLTFAAGQRAAIRSALESKISLITGGPGVGKTTILNGLLKILNAKRLGVVLAAPTGRASRRMAESTGQSAETIHKLLEYQPRGGFGRNRERPIVADVVICDEGSMIDLRLMKHLLDAMPDTASLLIVGDHDQLPSVGAGQVLADLIQSGCIPVARLDEIFRQGAGSPIIRNAHSINNGVVPDLDVAEPGFEFIATKSAEETADRIVEVVAGSGNWTETLVLIPMRRGAVGVEQVNERLQRSLNPKPSASMQRNGKTYGVGDRVIQTKNERELNLSNGDLGIIRAINEDEKLLVIDFDGQVVNYPFGSMSQLDLAFAMTVHKSQGSEGKTVVVAVDTSNSVLLSRKLLYTAVTRAKQRVILVGQKRAVHIAVSEARAFTRQTRLREHLIKRFSGKISETLST